jgi:hypothetical protein
LSELMKKEKERERKRRAKAGKGHKKVFVVVLR